jgi:hypothetical protein
MGKRLEGGSDDMTRIETINAHVVREYHRETGTDSGTTQEIMESLYDAAYAEGCAQQKAEIKRCGRLTNGGGYVPSGYKTGAYIVPAFALDSEVTT